MVSPLSEVFSETLLPIAFSDLRIWGKEKWRNIPPRRHNGCCTYPSLNAQHNQKIPKEYKPESWKAARIHEKRTEESREKREGEQEERTDGEGEWFKSATGLLRFLRKFWKVSEKNLQTILENIRYYLREPWGSRNRIYAMLLPEVAIFEEFTNIHKWFFVDIHITLKFEF